MREGERACHSNTDTNTKTTRTLKRSQLSCENASGATQSPKQRCHARAREKKNEVSHFIPRSSGLPLRRPAWPPPHCPPAPPPCPCFQLRRSRRNPRLPHLGLAGLERQPSSSAASWLRTSCSIA